MHKGRAWLHDDITPHEKTNAVAKLLVTSSNSATTEEDRAGARNCKQKYKINDVSVCAIYFCIYFGISYRMLVAARGKVNGGRSLNRHPTPKVSQGVRACVYVVGVSVRGFRCICTHPHPPPSLR